MLKKIRKNRVVFSACHWVTTRSLFFQMTSKICVTGLLLVKRSQINLSEQFGQRLGDPADRHEPCLKRIYYFTTTVFGHLIFVEKYDANTDFCK